MSKKETYMLGSPFSGNPGCAVCDGKGDVWKYFKDEVSMLLEQKYDYCPLCHPHKARVIPPAEGQVEIDYKEFDRLSKERGWKVN